MDLFIQGATIWTGDDQVPWASEMLVRNGRIVSLDGKGLTSGCNRLEDCEVISLNGESVVPGFSDSHIHLSTLARGKMALNLEGAESKEQLLEMVRAKAKEISADAWIYGVCFNETRWKDSTTPTRHDLDRLGISQPVLLQRVCTHINVANTKALEVGAILESQDVEGLYRDLKGEVTGVLAERAAFPLYRKLRDYLAREGIMENFLQQTCQDLARVGITSVHPCGAAFYGMEEDLGGYQALEDKGLLPVRIFSYHDRLPVIPMRSGFGDGKITYQGWKTFLDGTLGARTAALTAPYADDPGTSGTLNFTNEELKSQLSEVLNRGLQPLIHTIGDRALDQALEVLEELLPCGCGGFPYPVRINHVQICRPDQVKRLARLGLVCDVQPTFLPSDMNIAPARLGDRIDWAYAWKQLVEAGLTVTGSSDAPVEEPNPLKGIWAAVCRTGEDNTPPEGWNPSQKLTLDEALRLYTTNPARAVGKDRELGKLLPGYLADLVILDQNIFEIPPKDLRHVRVRATFLQGEVTYRAEQQS